MGCQRGCERRIGVFEKINKKNSGGQVGVRLVEGFRVDVNAMLEVGGGG